jgi:hypothetical protein
MRPLAVVDMAPAVEGGLRRVEAVQGLHRSGPGKDFRFEAAMQALVLAAALRMIRPAVDGFDAELEQPEAQRRPLAGLAAAPGRAVVDIDRIGEL